MLEIHIIFSDRTDAHNANEKICEFFKGSKMFINNDIIVTPVQTEYPENEKTFWSFNVCFYDSEIDKRVVYSSGELSVMGLKKVWAFNKLENYVVGKNE